MVEVVDVGGLLCGSAGAGEVVGGVGVGAGGGSEVLVVLVGAVVCAVGLVANVRTAATLVVVVVAAVVDGAGTATARAGAEAARATARVTGGVRAAVPSGRAPASGRGWEGAVTDMVAWPAATPVPATATAESNHAAATVPRTMDNVRRRGPKFPFRGR